MFIGRQEIRGFAALAPMAGVADRAFRRLCVDYGAAYVVSEMVSCKGLCFGDRKSEELLVLDEGAVVGKGAHDELLHSCPAYLEIAQSQLSARELGLSEDEIAAVMDGSTQEGGVR